jgi:hypothetical protein
VQEIDEDDVVQAVQPALPDLERSVQRWQTPEIRVETESQVLQPLAVH